MSSLDPADEVEIGQGGLDHQDVGALVDIEARLAHRLVAVGGVHLVAAPVAELAGAESAASRNGP